MLRTHRAVQPDFRGKITLYLLMTFKAAWTAGRITILRERNVEKIDLKNKMMLWQSQNTVTLYLLLRDTLRDRVWTKMWTKTVSGPRNQEGRITKLL